MGRKGDNTNTFVSFFCSFGFIFHRCSLFLQLTGREQDAICYKLVAEAVSVFSREKESVTATYH